MRASKKKSQTSKHDKHQARYENKKTCTETHHNFQFGQNVRHKSPNINFSNNVTFFLDKMKKILDFGCTVTIVLLAPNKQPLLTWMNPNNDNFMCASWKTDTYIRL